MDQALRNILQATGRPLREVWPMTSLNAAHAVGQSAARGSLAPGKLADLVLLDSNLSVAMTVAEGEIVFEAQEHLLGSPFSHFVGEGGRGDEGRITGP
jgi:N-acetylglucosamine-6-phosphate deacetylase